MTIIYADEPALTTEAFVSVLRDSGLAERRPVNDLRRMAEMVEHASILVTARDAAAEGKIVGLARSVTDFAYCCYCSDLAVHKGYQGHGIGRGLIDATRRRLDPKCTFHLISAPAAESYYENLGMERLTRAFVWPDAVAEEETGS